MTKCGYVAIISTPNTGKSTLLNSLVGEELSIVTVKPQTTRQRVAGILTSDSSQIIFWDTPGLFKPKYKLQERMEKEVKDAIEESDLLLFLVDGSNFKESFNQDFEELYFRSKKPKILALNKIDCFKTNELEKTLHELKKVYLSEDIIPISALRGDNLDKLRLALEELLPTGPFLYPPDFISSQTERFFASEIIREQIFNLTSKEVPYSTAVKIDEFRDSGSKAYIRAFIFTERDSQKKILIGAGGKMAKRIGIASREKIEAFLRKKVYLDIRVKTRKNWRKDDFSLWEFGYKERRN